MVASLAWLVGWAGGVEVVRVDTAAAAMEMLSLVDSLERRIGLEEVDTKKEKVRREWWFISVSLGARLALMNGSFPRFSPQDNPAACVRSDLTRFLTYAFLPVFNAWLLICPIRLSYDWQMGSIPLVETLWDLRNVYSAAFYFLFFRLLRMALRKGGSSRFRVLLGEDGPKILVSLLFISLPFLPASNLLFPVGFVAAERILYTPSVGMCILTAHGIDRVQRSLPKFRKVVLLCLCLLLMSFSVKTWDRNFVWKSRASLFESGVRENPWNAKVHYNYANLQKDLGDIETAVKHYKIAIRLWPSYSSAYNNLGALSEDMVEAEDSFLRAIKANPQHNGAHFNLGVIYM
ncbi:Transmembrane and TPR repeat-containing protein 1 [Folsomia candida]|uniref:dolichyl-phosphate-mannose--protein mannosyltransferase n=1 Tax=Folsomia candida TaxID=158441 RepID=A0A226ENS7_FOLCA|nr:Transmembrane and TPR repeat-containing protein 1 [Folsomia candida]